MKNPIAIQKSSRVAEYLIPEEVYAIADAIRNESPQRPGRNGERNSILRLVINMGNPAPMRFFQNFVVFSARYAIHTN